MVISDEKISYTETETGRKVILKLSYFDKVLMEIEQLKEIANNHAKILKENNLKIKMDADIFQEYDLTSEKEGS